MYKMLFSRTTLEILVSASITKVIGDVVRNNVVAVNPLQKLLRLVGSVVITSIVADYAIDYVNIRVTAMKYWWEKQREAKASR